MTRFFYHSFPRGDDEDFNSRALLILESVLDRGLLLTPERIEFREELTNGKLSDPWYVMQKRISFTELEPAELPQHTSVFGPISFEWKQKVLIEMGAIPVFYVPLRASNSGAYDGLASTMLARLGEVQRLLERLEDLKQLVQSTQNQSEPLTITRNGIPIKQTQCTVGGSKDLLEMLQTDIQPVDSLIGALRSLSGYFYPTDSSKYTDLLGYYRQREWRILANTKHNGNPITDQLNDKDIVDLLNINKDFFNHELDFRSGKNKRITGCQLFKQFKGAHIINTVNRLICPNKMAKQVINLLENRNIKLEVVSIEEYAAS